MRKFKKSTALILAAVICILTVFAVHVFAAMILDGYTYELDDYGRAIFVGWDNSSDTLYVPARIGNTRVIGIGNSAFRNDDFIHYLELSDATYMDSIGMYAFAGSALEGELVIPTRITSIGTSAFESCNSLTYVSFSSFGETVPAQCFQYCENLQTVVLTDYIATIERYAFYNCPNLTSVTVPRSVTNINSTAFLNDDSLTFYCYYDSYAHHFAEDNGIDYVILDPENIPTEPPTEPETEVPTNEPTQAPTEVPTESVSFILGDADGDGVIEVDDATYIQRVIAELPVPYPMETLMQGDVDGDGELTITDATLIQRYVAEMPVNYPIGEPIAK